mmetsp:Transcript_6519/g.14150  ORF Transcript_6519/g.14150 Transcript_6519/m.14150 type:complete len:323 (-) Transcript_6519:444-1412(-)
MTGGTSEVEKTALGKNDNSVSVLEHEAIHLGLDVDALGDLHETGHINFVIEVTNVSYDGVVLHLGHSFGHDDSLISGGGNEDVGNSNHLIQSGHGVSFHASLEGTDGVDLGHVHNTSVGTHGMSTSLSDISVSADDSLLSGHHDIGGTHDTVGERMLASVKVVKFGLGHGVVHIDGREKETSVLLHCVEAMDSSGGLLGNSFASCGDLVPLVGFAGLEKTLDDGKNNFELLVVGGRRIGKSSVLGESILGLLSLVDEKRHVSSVIDDDIGAMTLAVILWPSHGAKSALPVFLEGLSLPSEDGSTFVTSNSGGSVVLRRENVA